MTRLFRIVLVAGVLLCFSVLDRPLALPIAQAQGDEVATITGRVTLDVDGTPLIAVGIVLIDPDTPDEQVTAAYTDVTGLFTVTQAISNSWIIRFVPTDNDYMAEYYADTYRVDEAELVSAAVGTVTPNINASLATQGQISGRVTSAVDGDPIADVRVGFYQLDDTWEDGAASTDSTGAYTLTTYFSGTYKLRFEPPGDGDFALQYYKDQTSLSAANVVTVEAGRDRRGIDVTLQQGGEITGIVHSRWRGQLIDYPDVRVVGDDGEIIQFGSRYPDQPPGHYTIKNLPPGDYQLLFMAERHRPIYRPQLTHVEAGTVIRDINATLPMSINVGAIATSPAIPGTIMLAVTHDPTPMFTSDGGISWQFVTATPWITDSTRFAHPDRVDNHYMGVGIAPRGNPDEGTRLIVAVGDSSGYERLLEGFYRSGDNGESWADAVIDPALAADDCSRLHQSSVAVSRAEPTRLYALYRCAYGNVNGFLVSNNAGVTWHNVTTINGRTLKLGWWASVYPSPLLADRVYLLGETEWLESNDGGINWVPRDFPVESLALDAEDADTLYGWSLREGGPFTRFGRRSRDGGNQWHDWAQQPCPYSYRDTPPQLLAHPTESGILLLRCDNDLTDGLYRSENGGDTWQKLTDDNGQLLAADLGVPGRILWAKDDGLWATTDNGDTWHPIMQNYRVDSTRLYMPNLAAAS